MCVQSFPTLCLPTGACQAPVSMEFSSQEYWSGLFPLPGIFPIQGSNPCLLHLLHWQAYYLSLCYLGSPQKNLTSFISLIFNPFSSRMPFPFVISYLLRLSVLLHSKRRKAQTGFVLLCNPWIIIQ